MAGGEENSAGEQEESEEGRDELGLSGENGVPEMEMLVEGADFRAEAPKRRDALPPVDGVVPGRIGGGEGLANVVDGRIGEELLDGAEGGAGARIEVLVIVGEICAVDVAGVIVLAGVAVTEAAFGGGEGVDEGGGAQCEDECGEGEAGHGASGKAAGEEAHEEEDQTEG